MVPDWLTVVNQSLMMRAAVDESTNFLGMATVASRRVGNALVTTRVICLGAVDGDPMPLLADPPSGIYRFLKCNKCVAVTAVHLAYLSNAQPTQTPHQFPRSSRVG